LPPKTNAWSPAEEVLASIAERSILSDFAVKSKMVSRPDFATVESESALNVKLSLPLPPFRRSAPAAA
jgi:hypothetical protein